MAKATSILARQISLVRRSMEAALTGLRTQELIEEAEPGDRTVEDVLGEEGRKEDK